MSKPKIARKKRPPSTVRPQRFGEIVDPVVRRRALLKRVESPYRTLDDIVLTTRQVAEEGMAPLGLAGGEFTVTGEDLAWLLSYAEHHGNVYSAVDDGDLNLRLRGLADMIRAVAGSNDSLIDGDAAYFIARTLDDLVARLEASRTSDNYRVGVLAPEGNGKAVAS